MSCPSHIPVNEPETTQRDEERERRMKSSESGRREAGEEGGGGGEMYEEGQEVEEEACEETPEEEEVKVEWPTGVAQASDKDLAKLSHTEGVGICCSSAVIWRIITGGLRNILVPEHDLGMRERAVMNTESINTFPALSFSSFTFAPQSQIISCICPSFLPSFLSLILSTCRQKDCVRVFKLI